MDPNVLKTELDEAKATECNWVPGQARVYPPTFFDNQVFVTGPPGAKTEQRHPRYCATAFGAGRISQVLTEAGYPATITEGGALPQNADGPFIDTKKVPYLQFAAVKGASPNKFTGPKVNAAVLLDYFNSGQPADVCLASAVSDVERAYSDPASSTP